MANNDETRLLCPFCGGDRCSHLLGWTENGKTISVEHIHRSTGARAGNPRFQPESTIPPDAQVVKTGVSARVYWEGGDAQSA